MALDPVGNFLGALAQLLHVPGDDGFGARRVHSGDADGVWFRCSRALGALGEDRLCRYAVEMKTSRLQKDQ